jgi:hypothetical protein
MNHGTSARRSRTLLVALLCIAAGFGGSGCDVDSISLHIEQPSKSGAFTTNAATVVILGHVESTWYGSSPRVVWANDTTAFHGTAYRNESYFQTPAIDLVLGDNSIRVRASNDNDSEQKTIIVTRTP